MGIFNPKCNLLISSFKRTGYNEVFSLLMIILYSGPNSDAQTVSFIFNYSPPRIQAPRFVLCLESMCKAFFSTWNTCTENCFCTWNLCAEICYIGKSEKVCLVHRELVLLRIQDLYSINCKNNHPLPIYNVL